MHALTFRGGLTAGLLLAVGLSAQAQTSVGIGTSAPNPAAVLDLSSTSKGLLLPRLTQAQRDAISNPPGGLVIFQTDHTPGLYAYSGSAWVLLGADNLGDHTAKQAVNLQTYPLTGTGADVGTTVGLGIRADGGLNLGQNTAGNDLRIGYQAGSSISSAYANHLVGYQAGATAASSAVNHFEGYQAGQFSPGGSLNTFIGYQAGRNASGSVNLLLGPLAGDAQTGSANLIIGYGAGRVNTGAASMFIGHAAGERNTSGAANMFLGYATGSFNTTGIANVFVGNEAGSANTSGSDNTALGKEAGPASGALTNATAIGSHAKVAQSNSLVLGGTGAYAVKVGIGTAAPTAPLHIATAAPAELLYSGTYSGNVINSDSLTASSIRSPLIVNYLADGDFNTFWVANNTDLPQWARAHLGSATVVRRYRLYLGPSAATSQPKSWELQASADTITWTTLHTVTNEAYRTGWHDFYLTNTIAYPYYRLLITAIQSTGQGTYEKPALTEWELSTESSTTTPVALRIDTGTLRVGGLGNNGGLRLLATNIDGNVVGLASIPAGQGDNLGTHVATQDLSLGTYKLVGSGTSGLSIGAAGDVTTDGTLNTGGAINASGNITTAGSLVASNDLILGGSIISSGSIMTTGAITTVGSITTTSNISSRGGLTTGGAITAGGNVNLGANRLVGNGGTTGISISSTGLVTTDGSLITSGAITAGGVITAGGKIDLGANSLVGNGGAGGLTISSAGAITTAGALNATGTLAVGGGVKFPGAYDPDATYVGLTGNSISFAHTGYSEDFIGYKNNTFYLKDAPGGGDTADPALEVGGNLTTGGNLAVVGAWRLGTNGTTLTAVIKATVTKDVPSIATNSAQLVTFSVPNVAVGGSVAISPAADLPAGVNISYARVSSAGVVVARFANSSNSTLDPAAMDFYITVIQ